MARSYATENPKFLHNPAGAEGSHSSTQTSLPSTLEHAQSDEALADVSRSQDPNIAGSDLASPGLYSYRSGPLSAWQENDDYQRFMFDQHVSESATTHRFNSIHDGDYDDNGGRATTHGETTNVDRKGSDTQADEFAVGPVIRRRL